MSHRNRLLTVIAAAVLLGAALVLVEPYVGPIGEAGGLQAAFDAEFLTRPDGYRGLREHYDFTFPREPIQMAPGLMYKAVAEGAVDVIDAFATDGRIEAYDLAILEDDRRFFPPYNAAPLVRRETIEEHPELKRVLDVLADAVSDDAMRQMNYQFDEKGEKPRRVARRFLAQRELLPSKPTPAEKNADVIRVGSKSFTEQEILGEMMALLIEAHTSLKVRRNLNLGGTMLCFNAIRSGDIDVYPEYTGTGLVSILGRETIPDPDDSYREVKRTFAEKYDLVWLEPFGFNNTYTLAMRGRQAERLGISTISDLAEYIKGREGDDDNTP